jgi:hypothetical protein
MILSSREMISNLENVQIPTARRRQAGHLLKNQLRELRETSKFGSGAPRGQTV